MSGHHPPSWNHHPMQVPPYIPRLPMAHMSNDRPVAGAWHNNSGMPSNGPPQMPPGCPPAHNMGQPDLNQYPYHAQNNRKHPSMDMNQMLPPSQYVGRHPMHAPNNDYDTPMMDLSVSSRNNNSPRNSGGDHHNHHMHPSHQEFHGQHNSKNTNLHQQQQQQHHHHAKQQQNMCDGPLLPSDSSLGGDGYHSNDLEMLTRRHNPLGLPPLADAMELVKEALLNKVKAPAISDLGSDFNASEQLPMEGGVDLSIVASSKAAEHTDNHVSPGKEVRRRGRKPNKTSKVVNEEVNSSVEAVAAVVDMEIDREEKKGDAMDVNVNTKARVTEQEQEEDRENKISNEDTRSSPVKRNASVDQQTPPLPPQVEPALPLETGAEGDGSDGVKRKRNRKSVDKPQPDTVKPTTNGDESLNGTDTTPTTPSDKKAEDIPAPVKDPETSFEDVENKLSEMFAGIADVPEKVPESKPAPRKTTPGRRNSICLSMLIGDDDLDSSDDEDFCPEELEKKPAKGKRKSAGAVAKKGSGKTNGANNGAGPSPAAGKAGKGKAGGGGGGAAAAKKKRKKKGGGGSKWDDEMMPTIARKPAKEVDEGRYRGPQLQVRQDGNVSVLNGGVQGQAEDDSDARNAAKSKMFVHNGPVIRGLQTHTLSVKYDTDRTDTTWVCVFCKLGPHKLGLGDLFGPYTVTTDCDEYRAMETQTEDPFRSNRSRADMVQSAPHKLPAVPASLPPDIKSPTVKTPGKRGPKKKNPQTLPVAAVVPPEPVQPENLYLGLSKATDNSYEIWIHEDCIVWGSGIHMIAGRLVGVEHAVWGSVRSECTGCGKSGAVVCCLQRGCSDRVHLPCGRKAGWSLNEDELNSYCQVHRSQLAGVAGDGQQQQSVSAGGSSIANAMDSR